jgi:hypothetical protein
VSDPRDRIFGLLGLGRDSHDFHIDVDYEALIAQVYRDAAFSIMKQAGSLVLFGHVHLKTPS